MITVTATLVQDRWRPRNILHSLQNISTDSQSPNTFNNTAAAGAAATITEAVAEASAAATMIKLFRLFYHRIPHKSDVTSHLVKEFGLSFVPTLFRGSVNKPHSFFLQPAGLLPVQ